MNDPFASIPLTYLVDQAGGIYLHDFRDRQTTRLADFAPVFTDIAITPAGRIFANTGSLLYEVFLEEGTLRPVARLSSAANGLASDANGRLYVGHAFDDRIDVLDPNTFALQRVIDLPSGTTSAGDIQIVGQDLYFASSDRELLTIDLSDGTVTSAVFHGLPVAFGLHFLGEELVAFSGDTVYSIDRATGATDRLYDLVDAQFGGQVYGAATAPILRILGTNGDDVLTARFPGLTIYGGPGDDTLRGFDGADTLDGGGGDDLILGGSTSADLRDLVFGGAGNDTIYGGPGNDELRGDGGNDVIAGGAGADTVIGGTGNDTLTGSNFGDVIFGGDGFDFVNGGFGNDRLNGGNGGDRFFHEGVAGHGCDFVQDYDWIEGDVLLFGGNAARSQFQVNMANTASAGSAAVDEAFVIFRPTGQILWALIDGDRQVEINIRIDGVEYDLLA